jgi:hypothetical protein
MFDNPKKELEKLEKQLLEDEEWFQRELDSAKRMIGQVPAKQQRPSAPRTPQAPKAAPKSAPARSSGSKPKAQAVPVKEPVEKKKSNKGLVILACAETLGILGLAAYWVLFLLK